MRRWTDGKEKRGWSDSIEEKKWGANYTLKKKRTNSRRWYIDNWPNERTLFWRHSSSFFLSFFILTKHFLPVDFLLAGIWSRAEFHPLTFFYTDDRKRSSSLFVIFYLLLIRRSSFFLSVITREKRTQKRIERHIVTFVFVNCHGYSTACFSIHTTAGWDVLFYFFGKKYQQFKRSFLSYFCCLATHFVRTSKRHPNKMRRRRREID